MIGANREEDALPGGVEMRDALEHARHVAIRRADRAPVLGGAQGAVVPGVVRLGEPEHGERRPAGVERLVAEALRHDAIPLGTDRDREPVGERHAPGPNEPARW